MKKKPTKLKVLDFDGTLVLSPHDTTPVDGVPARERYDQWLAEQGKPKRKWLGWWGRKETLMPPIFGKYDEDNNLVPPPELLNVELAEKVKEFDADPDVLVVLMTGRHVGMKVNGEHICTTILNAYGINFDRYYFGYAGKPTIAFKIEAIQAILREFPAIRDVEIWEDRHAHTSEFWNFLKYWRRLGKVDEIHVHQVDFGQFDDMPEDN